MHVSLRPNSVPDGKPLRVGVVGGGTAGYLAALTLDSLRPDIDITLIESPRVASIGVGEGTTPSMAPFLHGVLGLDVDRLFRHVEPTFKLGVRLDWTSPDRDAYASPFAAPRLTDSYLRTGSTNRSGLAAALLMANRGVHRHTTHGVETLVPHLPLSYHLDNKRFLSHLRNTITERRIPRVLAHLVDANRAADGRLTEVVADDGSCFGFDLFVDCTGFRSWLLGEVMGTGTIDYSSTLWCDAAVVATGPHHSGQLEPFTDVTTMDHGWCWNVPQLGEDHRGYVFASSHCTPEQAADELLRRFPSLREPRLIRFPRGRRTRWWSHNVVAIGNSYGFVEPLLASGLHVTLHECLYLCAGIDQWQRTGRPPDRIDQHLASVWDSIRWLIAAHYRLNTRRQSPFWVDVNHGVDLGPVDALLREGIDRGSVASVVEQSGLDGFHVGTARDLDVLLLGMGRVAPEVVVPTCDDRQWRGLEATIDDYVRSSLTAEDSVRRAHQNPDELELLEAPWFRTVHASLLAT